MKIYGKHPKIHFLTPKKRTLEIKNWPLKVQSSFLACWGLFMPIFVQIRWSWFTISIFIVKKSAFFSTLKSILKIKNCKKGLSSSYLTTIYYIHAKGQLPTMISFRSGGGGSEHSGLSLYSSHTCIYIYYIYIYIM